MNEGSWSLPRSRSCPTRRRSCLDTRGQTDPLVTLVCVLVLCLGFSLYGVVLNGSVPDTERDVAVPTLARVETHVANAGVADPAALDGASSVGPSGYELNVSLVAAGQQWHAGPRPPPNADRAATSLGVRLAPGVVRSARLRVAVWGGGE